MRILRASFLPILAFFIGVALIHAWPALTMFHHAAYAGVAINHLQVQQSGMAVELISGFVTAPSTAQTAWTLAAGNSLQIRNCDQNRIVKLLNLWCDQQTKGTIRVRSPKMHDNVQGIRAVATASDCVPLMPIGMHQRLYPQDILTVDQSGSATGGDIESGSMLVYYEDLPGANARYITVDELMKRGVNELGVRNTLTTGAGGGYTGEVAFNATDDLFKANTDYALVGYLVDVECCSVRWRGADTGNYGVGGPGNETLRHVTANWFMRLSAGHGLPLIPVFNSANKQGILVDAVQDENAAAVALNSILVELAPR